MMLRRTGGPLFSSLSRVCVGVCMLSASVCDEREREREREMCWLSALSSHTRTHISNALSHHAHTHTHIIHTRVRAQSLQLPVVLYDRAESRTQSTHYHYHYYYTLSHNREQSRGVVRCTCIAFLFKRAKNCTNSGASPQLALAVTGQKAPLCHPRRTQLELIIAH